MNIKCVCGVIHDCPLARKDCDFKKQYDDGIRMVVLAQLTSALQDEFGGVGCGKFYHREPAGHIDKQCEACKMERAIKKVRG